MLNKYDEIDVIIQHINKYKFKTRNYACQPNNKFQKAIRSDGFDGRLLLKN